MRKKGFTLIELLAVIVILAIIALIAVPLVLNIIRDSKEKSALISVDNYLRAVENAVAKETMKNPNTNYDGKYTINNDGKVISSTEKGDITIEYNGEGLKSGIIVIGNGKVENSGLLKVDSINIKVNEGKIIVLEKIEKSYLVNGSSFNSKIKTLVLGVQTKSDTPDTKIKSIEFLTYGIIPDGYTLEEFQKLKRIDVSENKDGTILGIYDGKDKVYIYSENEISFNKDCNRMFIRFIAVETIEFGIFIDLSEVTTMQAMFLDCSTLTRLNLNNFNSINLINTSQMFQGCNKLTKLDVTGFNTSKVITMANMFSDCKNLKELDVSSWNTSNLIDVNMMFSGCNSLTSLNLSNFDTSQVTNMGYMFWGCSSLNELDISNFDTSRVLYLNGMFNDCKNLKELDISNWNTSSVTNMEGMFAYCSNLENINLGQNFNTSEVTNMSHMFSGCKNINLLNLINFDTSKVIDMENMFYNTPNLKPIYIGEKWVINEGNNTTNMFYNSKTTSLEELCEPNSTEEWCIIN